MSLTVQILSPEKTVFSGSAEAVFLPGAAGAFEVLPGHAAIVSVLDAGDVVVRTSDGEQRFAVKGGFVDIAMDNLTVCVK